MVVGNGLLGNKFKDYKNDDFIFLTAGVSDSNCNELYEFKKEENLIKTMLKKYQNKIFVYFSTISILNKKTSYTKHKKNIENIIKKSNEKYFIFRIPQIVGINGNPKNLFNYFKNSIKKGENIKVYNVYRSFVDIEDLLKIVEYVITNDNPSKIYSFSGIECLTVDRIISYFYIILGGEIRYDLIEVYEKKYTKNSKIINDAINHLHIDRNEYTKKLITKYIFI